MTFVLLNAQAIQVGFTPKIRRSAFCALALFLLERAYHSYLRDILLDDPFQTGKTSRSFETFPASLKHHLTEQEVMMSTMLDPVSPSGIAADSRILIGFPSQLDAQALEWIIRSQRGIADVHLCRKIEELMTHIRAESPRLILVDEEMADAHLPAIARQFPVRMEQSMIGVFADRFTLRQLEMAATLAHGLFSRDDSIPEFTEQLQKLLRRKKCVSTHLQSQVVLNSRNQFETKLVERVTKLTPRQMEVLVQIAQGKSAKEVAQVLHITEKAVESHKYRLMRALNMRDRVELCRWAIREGLISP